MMDRLEPERTAGAGGAPRRCGHALRLATLLLATLPLLACGTGSADSGAGDVDVATVLERAAERMASVGRFAFVLEHENGSTSIVEGLAMDRAEGRVSGGEAMQAEVTARAGPMVVNVGVIILPDQAWITNPLTGEWQPQPLTISQLFDPATGVPAMIAGLDEATLAGTATIDGAAAYRIEGVIASEELRGLVPQAAPGTRLPVRLWIGVDDPVVRRIELVGALEAQDAENAVRRLLLSDFDGDFVIAPPTS